MGKASQGSRRMEVGMVLLGQRQRPFISRDREKTTSTLVRTQGKWKKIVLTCSLSKMKLFLCLI